MHERVTSAQQTPVPATTFAGEYLASDSGLRGGVDRGVACGLGIVNNQHQPLQPSPLASTTGLEVGLCLRSRLFINTNAKGDDKDA